MHKLKEASIIIAMEDVYSIPIAMEDVYWGRNKLKAEPWKMCMLVLTSPSTRRNETIHNR